MANTNTEYKRCKGCKGCSLIESCLVKYDTDLVSKCPCSICLVKMICERMCYLRNHLYEDLPYDKRSLLIEMDSKNKRNYMTIDQQENTYGKYK